MRRQLTPLEQTERRAKQKTKTLEMKAEGQSTRAIAAQMGVDPMTVHADLRSGVEDSTPERPEKVKGLVDKSYPAKATPPEEIHARAERIQAMKKEGIPVKEIAKKEKVSTGTVSRYSTVGTSMKPRGPSAKQKLAEEAKATIAERKRELLEAEVEACGHIPVTSRSHRPCPGVGESSPAPSGPLPPYSWPCPRPAGR